MSFGVTAEGFVPKTEEDCLSELKARYRGAFGQSIQLDEYTIDGQLVAIHAEREALLWEGIEAAYHAFDPDSAVDATLDNILALSAAPRKKAKPSTVVVTATGTPSTEITQGSQVSVDSTGARFAADEDTLIATLDAWQAATAYAVGDRVTNDGDAWYCTVAGTSAGSGGPDSDGLDQGDTDTDNTVTWILLGDGTGAVDVQFSAVETGPTVAVAGDITTIETTISGWASAYNLLDAELGRSVETNEAARIRREDELASPGTGPADAIRADLLRVAGVTAAHVFVNNDDLTDVDGVPSHSVECLVQGGDDQDIFDQILQSVAGGIKTHGTESGTSVDSEGFAQPVKFSRPEEIDIYLEVTLVKEAAEYVGDDAIKLAIVTAGNQSVTGYDAVASRVSAWCFGDTGVLDVTEVLIDDESSPVTSTTVAVSTRQIAVYDTSRITINSSNGTP